MPKLFLIEYYIIVYQNVNPVHGKFRKLPI